MFFSKAPVLVALLTQELCEGFQASVGGYPAGNGDIT